MPTVFQVMFTKTPEWIQFGLSVKRELGRNSHDRNSLSASIFSYDTAKQIKERQDEYCSRVLSNDWTDIGYFPESLQWEALVDVLRGKVKVCTNM